MANGKIRAMNKAFRIVASCPDRVGIIAGVSEFVAGEGGWITVADQYSDATRDHFFLRYEVHPDSLSYGVEEFRRRFKPVADRFNMDWRITDASCKKRVVLMASKQTHCLADLLYRWRSREMEFDIPCVISNHDDLREYVEWHDIPYHVVPVTKENKSGAFAKIASIIDGAGTDVIVLARYMQIIPPELCARYKGRVINIHHSSLPAFAGARPYHQAYDRGVKLVGATCHYVTEELDAGPIIEQDMIHVAHHDTVRDLIRLGRDVEKMVLARGLRYHLEDRVIIHGNSTIVFS
jgi:formyltetrahydrofolate deformylase